MTAQTMLTKNGLFQIEGHQRGNVGPHAIESRVGDGKQACITGNQVERY